MGKIFENLFKKPLTQESLNLHTRRSNAESSHGPRAVGATIKKSNFACVYVGNISQYDSGEQCNPWTYCLNVAKLFSELYDAMFNVCCLIILFDYQM
jgi:hypothetical protein